MLHEVPLPARSNFSDFAVKYGKEERFRAIEKMRDREQLFSEYLSELKKANKMKDEHHKQAAKSKAEKVGRGGKGGRKERGMGGWMDGWERLVDGLERERKEGGETDTGRGRRRERGMEGWMEKREGEWRKDTVIDKVTTLPCCMVGGCLDAECIPLIGPTFSRPLCLGM